MSTLAGVQGDFQEYLLRGGAAIEAHVVGTERVPVATRLGIYGGAYGSLTFSMPNTEQAPASSTSHGV